MSMLSPRLQLRVAQKQILTPGLVQMVTVLQLNRLELREMISQEIAQNPVLDEAGDGGEELTPEEVHALLEAERVQDPADRSVTEIVEEAGKSTESLTDLDTAPAVVESDTAPEASAAADPFDQIDFGSFFDDYLDPGYRSPAAESVEKPSFETFLPSPVTLADHLGQQLALILIPAEVRDAADSIVGNLDENGYLTATVDEIAASGDHKPEDVEAALRAVQSLDPAGVGARDLRECLLLQLASRNAVDSVAWRIVHDHLPKLENRQVRDLAPLLGRPQTHIDIALNVIKHLNPRPGLRFSGPGARAVEPDVSIFKEGEDWIITLNDDDLPQLRLNPQYRRMLDKSEESDKDVRNYVRERYASALMLIKNIEQRKQTILKVCQTIVQRQSLFLENGIEHLKPMMIKEVAEEIGVHPSTVSRAVAGKYAHTPQGVYELRFFFSEAVQGPAGGGTPLLLLKRRVRKMIEEEDPAHPLTDDHITARLRAEGIQVTRRTVAKYREDMKIPSTHQRRVRPPKEN
jgi:RNA polymerase sigma-54 factor